MLSRALLALVAALGVAWVGLGCTEREQQLVVRRVLVDVEPGRAGPDGAFNREAIRRHAHAAVEKSPQLRFDPERKDGAVMRVRAAVLTTPAQAGKPRSTLTLAVELSGRQPADRGPGARFEYRGRSLSTVHGSVAADAVIEGALAEALGQALMARSAQKRPPDQLIAWLEPGSQASRAERKEAIILLGAARERAATDALIRVLGEDDRELAQVALASLTLIADPKAVDAIIAYSENKPNLLRKQAIDAVRVMGTKRGIAWLFTLSTGHPDADVQQAAQAALQELDPSFADPPTRVAKDAATEGKKAAPAHALP